MLKPIISIFCITLLIGQFQLETSAQTRQDAAAYFEQLAGPLDQLKKDTWQYLKAATQGKGVKKQEKKRSALLKEIKTQSNRIKKAGSLDGDDQLKKALIEYLDVSYKTLKEDFDQLMGMEKQENRTYEQMKTYLEASEKANEKMDAASATLEKAQVNFANTYNLKIEENEKDKLSEKIRSASKALKYYNQVFLLFYRANEQEAALLKAQNNKDWKAMEQHRKNMEQYAKEDLLKLKSLPNYNGDGSLKSSAQTLLLFYKKEATQDFKVLTDFYQKQTDFEIAKKNFESKSKKQRTQADVNQYNQAASQYNAAVKKVNPILETSNDHRAKHLERWNQTVDQFFKTHSQ